MLLDEKQELGKTEKEDDVIMVDADDVQEGTEGLSPDPHITGTPRRRSEGRDDVPSPQKN